MSVLRKEVWDSMGMCGKDLSWIRVVREDFPGRGILNGDVRMSRRSEVREGGHRVGSAHGRASWKGAAEATHLNMTLIQEAFRKSYSIWLGLEDRQRKVIRDK